MSSCPEELKDQADWHKKLGQGCLYASYMSKDPEKHGWKIVCLDEEVDLPLLKKIDETIAECIKDPKIQALSFVLPRLKTNDDLIKFVNTAIKATKWNIVIEPLGKMDLSVVKISVDLNEKTENDDAIVAWILGFGTFESFGKTRQSPYTELAMTVKSKQYFKSKHSKHSIYQYTPESQTRDKKRKSAHDSHLADIHLESTTNDVVKDKNFWDGTIKSKRKVLGLHLDESIDSPETKAKVTFVIQSYKE